MASELERLGAARLDGDQIGHEVLQEPEVLKKVQLRWGDRVITSDGQVDRSRLASLVFAPAPDGPRELSALEEITHPRIRAHLERHLDALGHANTQAVVLDAPVLFKAGWDQLCNMIIFVEASREARLGRARHRGWTKEQFTQREAAQESLSHKRSRADLVLDNSGSLETTRQQIETFWYRQFPVD